MKLFLATPLTISLLLVSLTHAIAQDETAEANRTVVVNMVDFGFDPTEITVLPGDTVRFVQTTASPHNVEFRTVPEGAELAENPVPPAEGPSGTLSSPPPKMGRYLTQVGETYEFLIDEHFAAGTYDYVCTPHETLGMTGTIVVEDRGRKK
jgi:plastocyanin